MNSAQRLARKGRAWMHAIPSIIARRKYTRHNIIMMPACLHPCIIQGSFVNNN